jgi:ATP-dependent DNA ligase
MEPWLQPMLCDVADDVPVGDDWIIERKLDGWRALVHRTEHRVKLYGGRNASDYTGKLPYIEGVVARLPHDSVLDGEIVAPAGWGSVQGEMRRNGPHEPSSTSPPLLYVVFDVIRIQGQDVRSLTWTERRALLDAAKFRGPLVFTSEAVEADPRVHQLWLDEGFEGSVAKRIDSRYRSGQRSPSWVKIKPQTTAEAKVVGFKPGTPGSEFDGTLGALEFELLDNGAQSRCSGMDRALRDEIWANQADWLDATIEIKHHGIGDSGKPRHPQFLRRREDRDPAPAPAPAPRAPRANSAPGNRPRNYKAMKPEKLANCLAELEGGYGDAFDRAEFKHTGHANELRLAIEAARSKGIR